MQNIRFLLKPHYANSHALIIGINDYKKASPLSYAVSDADEVRKVLTEELEFPLRNVIYLTDSQATRDNILSSYLRFAASDIDIDDRLFVFFAGHGCTRTGSRGEIGYLVPFDGDTSDLSTLIRWDQLTSNAELIRAKHILFVMDACYGGLALTRSLSPGSTRFLKDMYLRPARQVLTAGKADEVVADSGGPLPNHSVFTGHLIEGLRGKAAMAESIITASALMAYVYARVANDKNSHQTPHYGYFDGDGDFILRAPPLKTADEPERKDTDQLIAVPYPDEPVQAETTASKVRKAKALLASDSSAIELHDFSVGELRHFLATTSSDSFSPNAEFSKDEFLRRIAAYEEASLDISIVLACLAHWAKPAHMPLLEKVVARSMDSFDQQGGLDLWIELRWYPLLLELYYSGIAAVDGGRFDALSTIFYAPVPISGHRSDRETFTHSIARGLLQLNRYGVFKELPGHEKKYVPLSEHLHKVLQPRLDDVFFLGKNYEQAFDQFEVLFALVAADLDLIKGGSGWGPVGRFGWKHRAVDNGPLSKLVAEGLAKKGNWAVLQAGLFGGEFDRFKRAADSYVARIDKLGWW